MAYICTTHVTALSLLLILVFDVCAVSPTDLDDVGGGHMCCVLVTECGSELSSVAKARVY